MIALDKRRIAKNFGRAARQYEKHAVLQKTVCDRLLERLDLVKISPSLIVDLGSGTGKSARALAGRYKSAHVLQIDLSFAMLQESRSRSRKLFSRQHYLCADAEGLPLTENRAGLVFSSLTFQWCNDLDRAFMEAVRVLLPNGLFLFATLGTDTLCELRDCWARADNLNHVHTFYDMHDIGDALVRAGMTGVVMDTEKIVLSYPDCFSLMRDLKNVGALNAELSRARGLTGKRKLQQVVDAYEEMRQKDGLPATYEIVYGHAWLPEQKQRKPTGNGVTFVPVNKIIRRGG